MAAPSTPTNPTIAAGSGVIALSCDAASGATGYRWYRSLDGGTTYALLVDLVGVDYVDDGLANNIDYYYKVSAYNTGGESAPSSAVHAIPSRQVNPNGSLDSAAHLTESILVNQLSDFTATLPTPIKAYPYTLACWVKATNANDGRALICGIQNTGHLQPAWP